MTLTCHNNGEKNYGKVWCSMHVTHQMQIADGTAARIFYFSLSFSQAWFELCNYVKRCLLNLFVWLNLCCSVRIRLVL